MSRSKYEAQWSDGALDDGSHVVQAHDYAVEISSGRASTIHTTPTSIRYTPEVNSAKRLTVDVPPNSNLEGTDYLGGELKLIIDGKGTILFDIKKIDTNQDDGEDYTIRAFSKGQRLTGIDTEERVDNEVVYDYLAELVDAYSVIDNEHDSLRDTADETLSNVVGVGGGVREVDPSVSSGTATYSSVGTDASALDTLYVKLYTPGSDSIDVTITSTNNTYTESFSSFDSNKYGTWAQIKPGSAFDGDTSSYDVKFSLNGNSALIYWRAIQDEKLERNVDTPSVSSVSSSNQLYSRSGSGLNDAEDKLENGVVWDSNNSVYRPRHVSVWKTFDGTEENAVSDSSCTDGQAIDVTAGIVQSTFSYSVEDEFDGWELYARHKRITGTSSDDIGYSVEVDGSVETYQSNSHSSDFQWHRVAANDYFSSWTDVISGGGSISIRVEAQSSSNVEIRVGTYALILNQNDSPWSPSYTFDNTLHTSSGHLDRPYRYYKGGDVEFTEKVAQDNISTATVDSTIANTTNPVSSWGISQKIDINTSFPSLYSESQSDTLDFSYPGVTHKTKIKLGAAGSRDTASPRKGFNRMELSDYTVTVDQNDLPILFDQQVSGNNLSNMSSIAGDSAALFRWEGGYAKIFQLGSETTSPNLREESITSSVSIEDAYSSAQVYGLHNVQSPIFTSADAPSWLDQHKVLRDDSIETQEDAVTRCRSFLEKNGDIQYSGKIKTLPTFAPVGAKVDGSNFNHGKDMIIRSVSYSKSRTTISLGFEMDVGSEIVNLETKQKKSTGRETSKGMRVPVGQNNV